MGQIFRHFQADVAAADDNGGFRLVADEKVFDFVGIGNIAQGKNALAVFRADLGAYWLSAGRKHQVIIAFLICLAILQVADGDGFALGMDGDGFGKHAYIHIETVVEAFGRLQHQIFFFSDDIANIVRKTAVGKRNVRPAF